MGDMRAQAVMGVMLPEVGEARIAERWPSVVAASSGLARLGSAMQRTIILAPLAWFLLAPLYFKKVLPIFATRYTLTNRRLMIRKGWAAKPSGEVKLTDIEEVRPVPGTEQPFYRAADLEVISGGKVALRLRGVPEYKSFMVNIESARQAWGREQPKEQIHPATELMKMEIKK